MFNDSHLLAPHLSDSPVSVCPDKLVSGWGKQRNFYLLFLYSQDLGPLTDHVACTFTIGHL